jgi:hypothetical protein
MILNGVRAQSKDTSTVVVEGKIFDSTGSFSLPHATVALYRDSSNILLKYCLTDNLGEFEIKGVPIRTKMSIVITYSGYKQKTIPIYIQKSSETGHLGRISLNRVENELEPVVVRSMPPVVMHNDTLEFNSDAFRLDSSAVAEDLLARLPGVVVWADGSITVNGQEVNSVKVNGKPFFGGDTKVATRNLPKTAIEKVQVYKQKQDYDSRFDSTMEINFKLKESASSGYFGKAGGGYGTRQRYDADGAFNFYTPLTQLGIVGATNNTNKVADDVNTLLRNSTFKDQQATLEYQSNFQTQGINQPNAIGFVFQHDLIPDGNNFKNNRLSGNYLFNNNNVDLQRTTLTKTYLGGDSSQTQGSSYKSLSGDSKHNFSAEYNFRYDKLIISLKPNIVVNDTYNHSYGNTYVLSADDTLSRDKQIIDDYSSNKKFELEARYEKDFMLQYTIREETSDQNQYKNSGYNSAIVPESNFSINRNYSNALNKTTHHLEYKSPDLAPLFKRKDALTLPLWGINIYAIGAVTYITSDKHNKVIDFDSVAKRYLPDSYLSDKGNYHEIHASPGILLRKTYFTKITNRFNKTADISFTSPILYYYQNNSSEVHPELNFTRKSYQYTPEVDFSYTNEQLGSHTDNYTSGFKTEKYFPKAEQLYPLVDSSNPYYLQLGNARLNPYTKNTLSFSFRHASTESKNTFSYNLELNIGYISDNIADSSIIQSDGKTFHYYSNAGKSKFLNLTGELKKAFKFGHHALQLSLTSYMGLQKNPSYTNNTLYVTQTMNSNQAVSVNYSYSNVLSVFLKQNFLFYKSVQEGTGNAYQYRNSITTLNFDIRVIKEFVINTNATYNKYVSESFSNNDFFLWNASCYYRMLKEKNLELKLSALDILHQNKGIINSGSTTSISQGNVNVLRNYFSFSIYYFPKHFGH